MRLVASQEGGDRVGGDARQEDAVAEVAGGDDAASVADHADDGAVVGGAWPQAGTGLGEDQLADRGNGGGGVAEQVGAPAGGDVPVVTFLLSSADDELSVFAGDEVDIVALDDRPHGVREDVRHVPRVPQAEDLALDRADRPAERGGDAVEGSRGVAGGDDDVPCGQGLLWRNLDAWRREADLNVPHLC